MMLTKKHIKVDSEVHEGLTKIAIERKIPISAVVGYLWDINKKYDLLDPDWKENLTGEAVEEALSMTDKGMSQKFEIEKHRLINRAKFEAFKQYLNLLEGEEKKEFLENILGNMQDQEFIDNISNYQMFMVDGQKRFYQVKEGKPIITGASLDQIITCEMGYHIKNTRCDCRKWNDCDIRTQEYMEYLMKVDPNMLQERTRRFAQNYKPPKLENNR